MKNLFLTGIDLPWLMWVSAAAHEHMDLLYYFSEANNVLFSNSGNGTPGPHMHYRNASSQVMLCKFEFKHRFKKFEVLSSCIDVALKLCENSKYLCLFPTSLCVLWCKGMVNNNNNDNQNTWTRILIIAPWFLYSECQRHSAFFLKQAEITNTCDHNSAFKLFLKKDFRATCIPYNHYICIKS